MRLVDRGRDPRWAAPVAVLAAIGVTAALTAGPIRLAGANPPAAFERYLVQPLSSSYSIQEVLLAATPLMLTGLAVAVAFRAGYWNIGAEGQFLLGAIGATLAGLYLPDLPSYAAIPLGLALGTLAGALWGLLPALLRTRIGLDEVVLTLLLNPVALLLLQGLLNGPWRHPETGFSETQRFGAEYELPGVLGSDRVHIGLVIALLIAVGATVVLRSTALGLRLRAVGGSHEGARFVGIDVAALQFRTALASAAIAGLGGAVQVLGVNHQLNQSISNGYGYTGVVVATLGALIPLGAVLAAMLLAVIAVGAQSASIALHLPSQMGDIVSSTLLLAVVAALVLRHYRIARAPREPEPPDEPAPIRGAAA
jgi:general nucleoside transport system permease protein